MRNFRGQIVIFSYNNYLYTGRIIRPVVTSSGLPWVSVDASEVLNGLEAYDNIVYRTNPISYEDFPEDLNPLGVYFNVLFDEKKSKKR